MSPLLRRRLRREQQAENKANSIIKHVVIEEDSESESSEALRQVNQRCVPTLAFADNCASISITTHNNDHQQHQSAISRLLHINQIESPHKVTSSTANKQQEEIMTILDRQSRSNKHNLLPHNQTTKANLVSNN